QLEAATADGACQPQLQHQSLYPAASDPDALPVQLLPDLLRTVDLLVLVPDSHDLDTELLVALRARRASLRLSLLLLLCVVGRRSDRQYIADRLDSVLLTVLVDERHHHFARRSSSACAKYADALRRISLARRSSRFSRSSSLSRSRSWLVRPGRCPASLWRRRIQPRSVSAEQPIFCATDWIAAHSDSYSCACSPTSRTARSRTSAEYCFALAMAPISQGLEPPANSGRFNRAHGAAAILSRPKHDQVRTRLIIARVRPTQLRGPARRLHDLDLVRFSEPSEGLTPRHVDARPPLVRLERARGLEVLGTPQPIRSRLTPCNRGR